MTSQSSYAELQIDLTDDEFDIDREVKRLAETQITDLF